MLVSFLHILLEGLNGVSLAALLKGMCIINTQDQTQEQGSIEGYGCH